MRSLTLAHKAGQSRTGLEESEAHIPGWVPWVLGAVSEAFLAFDTPLQPKPLAETGMCAHD